MNLLFYTHNSIRTQQSNFIPKLGGRGTFRLGGGRSIQLSYADMFNFWLIYWVFRPSGATPRSPGLRPVSSIMKLVPSPILVDGFSCIFRDPDAIRTPGRNNFPHLVDGTVLP